MSRADVDMAAGVGDVQLDIGRLDGDAAAAGHGVAGVNGEVQQDLLQLTGVHLTRPGRAPASTTHSMSSPIRRRSIFSASATAALRVDDLGTITCRR